MKQGILIAVEGIDGAGKTTQVTLLADFLRGVGELVTSSKEPTDGPWGQRIRESAQNGRLTVQEELRAFVEDRKEHVRDVITPALADGAIVILDRYFYSTIAYQGSRGLNVAELTAQVTAGVPIPDVVFLLDVPPEVGRMRISQSRGESPNKFETESNLVATRSLFLEISGEHSNMVTLNAMPPAGDVHRSVLQTLIDGVLKSKRCAKPWGCDVFYCIDRMTGKCDWAKYHQAIR